MVGDSGSSERVLVSVCLFRVRGVHFRSVVRSFVCVCLGRPGCVINTVYILYFQSIIFFN